MHERTLPALFPSLDGKEEGRGKEEGVIAAISGFVSIVENLDNGEESRNQWAI
jgi:hypothetical protein